MLMTTVGISAPSGSSTLTSILFRFPFQFQILKLSVLPSKPILGHLHGQIASYSSVRTFQLPRTYNYLPDDHWSQIFLFGFTQVRGPSFETTLTKAELTQRKVVYALKPSIELTQTSSNDSSPKDEPGNLHNIRTHFQPENQNHKGFWKSILEDIQPSIFQISPAF